MSGGSNVKFPGPSPQEEALQAEQTSLLKQQRDILQAQNREAQLLAPVLYGAAGVRPITDPQTGQTVGFEEIPDPNKAASQEIQQRLQQRTLAALKGELPDNPALLRDLAKQEAVMRETLRRNLGAGGQTGTAGLAGERNIAEFRQGLLEAGRRGDLTLGEQLGLAREAANQQRTQNYMQRLIGTSSNPLATASAFGQAATGYSAPLQQLLGVRQGRMQATAQREALNQAETGMWLGFASDVLGSVASVGGAAMSSARLKKDIAPFDRGEYGEAMKKLRETPIARWRYRWEDDAREPHVGPILELSPKEIHVGDGTHISLLDYAGMLHAGLKSVDRDVRTLREAMAEG